MARPKGSKNKFTKDAQEAMQQAFQGVGGVKTLTQWANENLTEFFKIYARLIPQQQKTTHDGGVTVRVEYGDSDD